MDSLVFVSHQPSVRRRGSGDGAAPVLPGPHVRGPAEADTQRGDYCVCVVPFIIRGVNDNGKEKITHRRLTPVRIEASRFTHQILLYSSPQLKELAFYNRRVELCLFKVNLGINCYRLKHTF